CWTGLLARLTGQVFGRSPRLALPCSAPPPPPPVPFPPPLPPPHPPPPPSPTQSRSTQLYPAPTPTQPRPAPRSPLASEISHSTAAQVRSKVGWRQSVPWGFVGFAVRAGDHDGVPVGVVDPQFPVSWAVAMAFGWVSVWGSHDWGVQLLGAGYCAV